MLLGSNSEQRAEERMGDLTDIYSALNWGQGVVEHPQSAGEHTGWAMAGVGADFVGLTQALAEEAGAKVGNTRLAAAAATPIIRAGLLAMMGMSSACGFGGPEKGDRFGQGSEAFTTVSDALGSTKPPDSWQGDASGAYANRNHEQQRRADAMAEIDRTVKQVLDDEAEQVDVARKMLDRCQTSLGLAIPAALLAKTFPVGGAAISLGIEMAAVAATLPLAVDRFGNLAASAAHNATLIRRAGASYDEIASGAQPA